MTIRNFKTGFSREQPSLNPSYEGYEGAYSIPSARGSHSDISGM
jgi:hypothetical protein